MCNCSLQHRIGKFSLKSMMIINQERDMMITENSISQEPDKSFVSTSFLILDDDNTEICSNVHHNHHHHCSCIICDSSKNYGSIHIPFSYPIRFIITLFITKYLWPKWAKHRRCLNKYQHNSSSPLSSLLFRIFLICFILCSLPTKSVSECKFPEQWWGSWFQKGVSGTIYINKNNITEKGICRKNNGEKYLIENRNERCVRCLFISERHANILQYKETGYCYPLSESSFEICSDINGDAPLYSLFRVNTSPIKCPFQGPFTFSYSKGILNECKDPLSTVDECTDDRYMLFKFRACIDIPGSESKVEELECIGDYREGSFRYLVGKMKHQLATTDEDRFRCFVIEKNNSDIVESYNIGQSGDASCEGLFTPRDGSRTFKLRKANQVKPSCDFPIWLIEPNRWTTLDNRHVYDFAALNQFTVYDVKNEILRKAKCIRSDDVSFLYSFNTSRFIIHTTAACSSGYACMHVYQRENRITELQIGNIVSDPSDACSPTHSNLQPSNLITLTTLDQETRPCELSGIFSIRTRMPYNYSNKMANYSRLVSLLDSRFMCQQKALKLKSNCDEPNLFQFICTTDNRVKNFYCRGGWKENNTQYILVSLKDKFNYEYCIAYHMDSQEIKLIRNSHFCYRNDNDNDSWPSGFRPSSINIDHYPKYSPVASKYDESVSFTLIKDGSCQRSGIESNSNSNSIRYMLVLNILMILFLRFIQI